jgi:SAM-dependent methyltransferase
MKRALLDHLVCPICRGAPPLALREAEGAGDEVRSGCLACPGGHRVAIESGIPDFLDVSAGMGERSRLYDTLWQAHAPRSYAGRVPEYVEKFQAFARLPGALDAYFAGKTVLDAGCGEGRFTYLASALGARHVVAVDASREALARASAATAGADNCSFVRASIMALPFRRAFDYVFSLGVLHHTASTEAAFRAVIRPLKIGGYVTIFVYGKWTLPLVIWPLRRLCLGADRERVLRFCEDLGFGYDPSRPPRLALGRLFRGLGRLDVLGLGRITFEGLMTPYLWEQARADVRRWFHETGVEMVSSTRMVSASGRLLRAVPE